MLLLSQEPERSFWCWSINLPGLKYPKLVSVPWEHKNDMAFFFDVSVNKEWAVEPRCCLTGLWRVYSLKMGNTLITCLGFLLYVCIICLKKKSRSFGHSGNYIINYVCQNTMWPKVNGNFFFPFFFLLKCFKNIVFVIFPQTLLSTWLMRRVDLAKLLHFVNWWLA